MNINRVVSDREPDQGSRAAGRRRDVDLQAADRVQHPPQEQLQRRSGRRSPTTSTSPSSGRAGRELRAVPQQGTTRRDRRPAGVARVGGQEGQKRQSVDIIADTVQFLGGRDDAGNGNGYSSGARAIGERRPDRHRRFRGRAGGLRSCGRRYSVLDQEGTEWRSNADGRYAGATGRAGRPHHASQAVPVLPGQDRPRRLQGPVDACAGSCPSAARSARGGSPAPAVGIRARSRGRSSAPASWRCCRT